MARMHRTQVYLEPDLNEALDRVARRRGTSKAELIRAAARRFLDGEPDGLSDPIWGLVGMGRSGYTDTSERHDEVLAEIILEQHRSK